MTENKQGKSCAGLIDGEPCSHSGCLNHISHPCEGCRRIAGKWSQSTPQPEQKVGVNLNDTTDAVIWAREFMRLYDINLKAGKNDWIDEPLMISWFANSIMAGYDEGWKRGKDSLGLEQKTENSMQKIRELITKAMDECPAVLYAKSRDEQNGRITMKNEIQEALTKAFGGE